MSGTTIGLARDGALARWRTGTSGGPGVGPGVAAAWSCLLRRLRSGSDELRDELKSLGGRGSGTDSPIK